jgi:hypothetical protein
MHGKSAQLGCLVLTNRVDWASRPARPVYTDNRVNFKSRHVQTTRVDNVNLCKYTLSIGLTSKDVSYKLRELNRRIC